MTLSPPQWTDEDRALVLAFLAEERETCPGCGHPMSEARDPGTMRQWSADYEICQPCVIAQVTSENESKRRGLYIRTHRSGG